MTKIFDDVKYALALQRKQPGFTVAGLLIVAVSIGCTASVFSVVNAILIKPLPYPDAKNVVALWRLAPKSANFGYAEIPWGIPNFRQIVRDVPVFRSVTALKPDSFNLTGVGEPVLLQGVRVSSAFFATLGVQPIRGRAFTSEEDVPGHQFVAVLSYNVWQNRFAADPATVGRSINLNGHPYSVVGVMPPEFSFPRGEELPGSFAFPRRTQIWIPLDFPLAPNPDDPDELAILARLQPGANLARAQAAMRVASSRMDEQFPQVKGWFGCRVTPLPKQAAGDTRTPLLLTLGAVFVLLLIACANLANLLLVRSLDRTAEFSLRLALGAEPGRLALQLITESFVLAAGGGILGILLANSAIHLLKVVGPQDIPRLQDVTLDAHVLIFAVGMTLLSAVLFGLAPAIAATHVTLAHALRSGARAVSANSKARATRNSLLIVEVALTLVLLITSGSLVQTFMRLLSGDAGISTERVTTFELSLPLSSYKDDNDMVAFYRNLLATLRTMPQVEAAGLTEMIPLDGAADFSGIRIPGRSRAKSRELPIVNYTIASPGFFSALGTSLLRGRPFLDSDVALSQPVAIVNRTMAAKFWPGVNPLGKQVGLASSNYPLMTIVGVVADVKHLSLREDPSPEVFVPYTQNPFPSMRVMHFIVRAKSLPAAFDRSLASAVHSLDAGLPVADMRTLQTIVDSSVARPRFATLVVGGLAAVSLVLACFGIYGVIAYSVKQRTREIGVRLALGAERAAVLRLVIGEGARLSGLGISIGLLAAAALTRLLSGLLFGVEPLNFAMFAAASALLLAIALLACYLPALRATRIDPIVALRYE